MVDRLLLKIEIYEQFLFNLIFLVVLDDGGVWFTLINRLYDYNGVPVGESFAK